MLESKQNQNTNSSFENNKRGAADVINLFPCFLSWPRLGGFSLSLIFCSALLNFWCLGTRWISESDTISAIFDKKMQFFYPFPFLLRQEANIVPIIYQWLVICIDEVINGIEGGFLLMFAEEITKGIPAEVSTSTWQVNSIASIYIYLYIYVSFEKRK